jgi:flagellar motor switch protein FliG
MRAALRELSSEIGATLSGMKATIGALQQKQDEMADQLAFGPREPAFAETRRDLEHLRPFDLLRRADPGHLLGLLQQEHPQLVALVLSYLEPQMASGILGDLPPELQPDVARRIAGMDRTSPEVLRAVERVLEMRLSVRTSEDYTAAGGTEGLVEILGAASRSTERRVVESLEKIDPELAEDISRRMFVFEDIVLLDRRAADAVVGRTETETLLRALKGVPPEVQSFIWESVPREDVPRLRKRLQEMGPVRLYEVEKAQQTIVATIRDLEEAGEIIVARPGEPPKVVE